MSGQVQPRPHLLHEFDGDPPPLPGRVEPNAAQALAHGLCDPQRLLGFVLEGVHQDDPRDVLRHVLVEGARRHDGVPEDQDHGVRHRPRRSRQSRQLGAQRRRAARTAAHGRGVLHDRAHQGMDVAGAVGDHARPRGGVHDLPGGGGPARAAGQHPQHRGLQAAEAGVAGGHAQHHLASRHGGSLGEGPGPVALAERLPQNVQRVVHAAEQAVPVREVLHGDHRIHAGGGERVRRALEVHVGRGAGVIVEQVVRKGPHVRRESVRGGGGGGSNCVESAWMAVLSENEVLKALATIVDPDLGRDVVSLGMIKELRLSEAGQVAFTFELTTPACPVRDRFKTLAEDAVGALPGVTAVEVKMTANVRPGVMRQQKADILPGVKQTIAVASGKGGVGKSTVAVNLAAALAKSGAGVGLLDADIYGPSVPGMTGSSEQPDVKDVRGPDGEMVKKLIPLQAYGLKLMSMGLLAGSDKAMVWRGPMVSRAIEQFMSDVHWGDLDYLVIDLPPGTGDASLTVAQRIPLTGVAIVATPQDIALDIAVKALQMFRSLNVTPLGLIENMSWFVCGAGGAAAGRSLPGRHTPPQRHPRGGGPRRPDRDQPAGLGRRQSLHGRRFADRRANLDPVLPAAACHQRPLRDPDPFPTQIDLVRSENVLEVTWEDGSRTVYRGDKLRWACPCAECRGEMGAPGRLDHLEDLSTEEATLAEVALVGQYAVQIGFASGHSTGIYTFRNLRSLADNRS